MSWRKYRKMENCFSSNRKKNKKIDKDGDEDTTTISYKIKFIDSARFMVSSLSNLVDNPSEGIHRIKCKLGHNDKKCQTCGIKYMYYDCFLEYKLFQDYLTEYKYLCCNKTYQRKFDEKLKERYFNIYTFSNHDNNKFILVL